MKVDCLAREALSKVEYGREPSLFAIADSKDGLERLAGLAERSGCRVGGAERLETACDRLEAAIGVDEVVVELQRDSGPATDRLLARLLAQAENEERRIVLAAPAELIDLVFAKAFHPNIQPLCDPDEFDWMSAIALAGVRTAPKLHDITKGDGTARLQQLSEEIGRIASMLAALSEGETAADANDDDAALDARQIRAIIRARRLREQFFRSELFADPAWDMLLDLMAARLEGRRVAVSSLCIAAAVPPTTALRWIKALCEQGLFVRVADPADGRRVFIELAEDTAARLGAYFKAAQRIAPSLL